MKNKNNINRLFSVKNLMLLSLFLLLSACNRNSFSRISVIEESVADTVAPYDNQTEDEQRKILLASDAIDDYIAKQEQFVINTKPNDVYTINIPDSLLAKLDAGDLYTIDIYSLGELSSLKVKVLFEDAVYGYSQFSPHGSQKLLFYTNQNNLLGSYYMSMMDKPTIVGEDSIRFQAESECQIVTTLNFKDSIPSEIFIRCTDTGGDIYTLSKTENE